MCGACGAGSAVHDGGPTPTPTLTPVGTDQIGLGFGESASLRVRYTDAAGAASVGQTVAWMIVATPPVESDGGATLGGGHSTTGADGVATVTVTAGAAAAQFRVRAQASGAPPASFYVTVTDQGFVSFVVVPAAVGDRPTARVDVLLYADVDCSALHAENPAPSPFPTRTFDGYGHAATWSALAAGSAYAVLGRAENAAGTLVGDGCIVIAPAQLLPGTEVHLALPIVDRPPALAPGYAVTSSLDAGAAVAAATAGSGWQAAACPLGPAQLLLDCALDELDGGDPEDCVMANPGPTALALAALRGAADAAGCRPATLGLAPSLDALVMDALGGDGTSLRAAAAALPSTLSAVALESTLGTSDTLVRARFQAGGASHAVELLASARPVVSAAATETVSGSVVTIADHGFTLRFGDAAREVFRALLWDQPPDALGSVLAAHCASVSAAGCTGNCMVDACTKGAAVLAARLGSAFRRLDAAAIDFRLAGTATLVDANLDGKAEAMQDGAWTAKLLVGGAWIDVAGTFSATAL
ncbi:MAG TPA: hypothetical protein VKE22_23050 [Haliangiales bacterium]|nr:hypothetical protein [Haliangiales bacterium]